MMKRRILSLILALMTAVSLCVPMAGAGAESDVDQPVIETSGAAALATPKLSSVANAANGVTIKWGAVSGAAKYRVFYKTGSSGWKKIADTTSTSYTWTGAQNGTKYTFAVRCVSADGTTFTSAYDTTGKSITYTSGQLATPKLSSVANASNGVTIKWGAVSGAAKYRVFYKTGSSGWKKIADTTSTSYTWTGAQNGTAYTFTVRCVSADGTTFTSAYDTTGKSVTYTSGQLATPKLSSVANASNGVTIKWGAVSGAAKYRVFYKTGSSGWKKIADTTSTSYTWTGAQNGTKYTFTVRCVSADGATFTSAYDTAGKSFTYTSGQLATPKLSSVANASNGVTIKWGAVSGAAKYRVFYKTGSGGWTKIADTTSTSYTWTGAKSGTAYTFTVRCVSADGTTFTSAYDTTGKSITYTNGQLATPKLSSVANAANGVTVKWGAVSGAAKYRVFYKTGSGGWTKIADTTSTSYTWTGAKSGTAYTFTVRCVSADGATFTSAYDTTGKSITYVAAPAISKLSSEADGVTITWSAVSGAAKYAVFYKNSSGSWSKIDTVSATSYTWNKAKDGNAYTFTVRATDSNGNYVSAYDTTGKSITFEAPSSSVPSASKIQSTFAKLKEEYPDFTPWNDDDNKYVFVCELDGNLIDYNASGCAAFAWICSNTIFGDVPAYTHNSFDNVKVGDIIRCYGDTHSVIVTEKKANSVVVAQGNLTFVNANGAQPACVYWGQEIDRSEFDNDPYFEVTTRYPR